MSAPTTKVVPRKLLVVCLLAVAPGALAYVLPGSSILRRMLDAREELHLATLRVEGSVSFQGEAAPVAAGALGLPLEGREVVSDARVLLRLPGRCRLEVVPVEGGKAAVVQRLGKLRVEGREVPALAVALRQVCALLGWGGAESDARAALDAHLKSLRIDPTTTWLARFGGQVAYVLGERAEGQPQLWVYKDSFLPARVRLAEENGAAWDIRFLDYTSAASGEWFPRLLEVYRGAELQLRFTTLKANARADVPDTLF